MAPNTAAIVPIANPQKFITDDLRRAIGGLLVARDLLAESGAIDDWPDDAGPEPKFLQGLREAFGLIEAFLGSAQKTAEAKLTSIPYDPETGYDWDGLRAKILKVTENPDDNLSGPWAWIAEGAVVGVAMEYGPRALRYTSDIAKDAIKKIGETKAVQGAVERIGESGIAKKIAGSRFGKWFMSDSKLARALRAPTVSDATVQAAKRIATAEHVLTWRRTRKILLVVAAIGAGGMVVGHGAKKLGEGAATLGKGALWLGAGALALLWLVKKKGR